MIFEIGKYYRYRLISSAQCVGMSPEGNPILWYGGKPFIPTDPDSWEEVIPKKKFEREYCWIQVGTPLVVVESSCWMARDHKVVHRQVINFEYEE